MFLIFEGVVVHVDPSTVGLGKEKMGGYSETERFNGNS